MNLGIVGMGVVGKALYDYYRDSHDIWTYDIATDTPADLLALNRNSKVVFVAVPTPLACENGMLDVSAVTESVSKLEGNKVVIVKSTLNVGTTEQLAEANPAHTFFFVPEFLSDDTAANDYRHPRRPHVVGCVAPGDAAAFPWGLLPGLEELRAKGYNEPVTFMASNQAELLKLMTNAFYAAKVTFANQMYDIGAEQRTLDCLGDDPWIGRQHLTCLHKSYRGYGGKCLVKDTEALAHYQLYHETYDAGVGEDMGTSILLKTTDYNQELLRSQGIDWREFAGCKK